MTPGKVWVRWPHEVDKSYPYRVGLDGKMDLEMAKAGIGGHYQPDTLPILVISKPRADEKTSDEVADPPFVIGDRVKLAVGLEELREMIVDSGMYWSPKITKRVKHFAFEDAMCVNRWKERLMFNSIFQVVVNEILIIKKIDNKDNTAKVVLANKNSTLYDPGGILLPVKALRRLITWLPVGAVVQIINTSHSNGMDMAHDVVWNSFFLFLSNFSLHEILFQNK